MELTRSLNLQKYTVRGKKLMSEKILKVSAILESYREKSQLFGSKISIDLKFGFLCVTC